MLEASAAGSHVGTIQRQELYIYQCVALAPLFLVVLPIKRLQPRPDHVSYLSR